MDVLEPKVLVNCQSMPRWRFFRICFASKTNLGTGGLTDVKYRVVCRAFQGLGGAGIYTLTLFSILRILPYEQYDKASSLAGGIISIGLVLGPLLGGAISNDGKWRWVFLMK